MAVTMAWDDPAQTILLITVAGKWEIDDYYEKFLEGFEMMNAVAHPMALIIDMTESLNPPTQIMSTASFTRKNRSENLVFTAVAGASHLTQMLASTMMYIIGRQGSFAFAKTVDEARNLCRERLETAE